MAEGAPLLRVYGLTLIEGSNPSLSAISSLSFEGLLSEQKRQGFCFAPVAQLDRVLGYEPSGQRFESSLVHHSKKVF